MIDDFRSVYLRFDPDDGTAEIRGQEPRPMRVVWNDRNDRGDDVYVVKVEGHTFNSLATRRYAPAQFIVYAADYESFNINEEREEDRPWIRVTKLVAFPVSIGTRRGLGL